MHKDSSSNRTKDSNSGEVGDFQTMRPPHLFTGLSVVMLQLALIALSMTLAMMEYPWLSLKAGFAALMGSVVLMGVPNLLVLKGWPKAVFGVQAITLGYMLLILPLLWRGEVFGLAAATMTVSGVLFYLTFSARYRMFVAFYKVIWERYRARKRRLGTD